MSDKICPLQDASPISSADIVPTHSSARPPIAGGAAIQSAKEAAIAENALIFSEIDRLLATACAMAQYCDRSSVGNAIALAIRINKMDYEGRHLEFMERGERL